MAGCQGGVKTSGGNLGAREAPESDCVCAAILHHVAAGRCRCLHPWVHCPSTCMVSVTTLGLWRGFGVLQAQVYRAVVGLRFQIATTAASDGEQHGHPLCHQPLSCSPPASGTSWPPGRGDQGLLWMPEGPKEKERGAGPLHQAPPVPAALSPPRPPAFLCSAGEGANLWHVY